jgi:hypothetical protein
MDSNILSHPIRKAVGIESDLLLLVCISGKLYTNTNSVFCLDKDVYHEHDCTTLCAFRFNRIVVCLRWWLKF